MPDGYRRRQELILSASLKKRPFKVLIKSTNETYEYSALEDGWFNDIDVGDHIVFTFDFMEAKIARVHMVYRKHDKKRRRVWIRILSPEGDTGMDTRMELDDHYITNVMCRLKLCQKK